MTASPVRPTEASAPVVAQRDAPDALTVSRRRWDPRRWRRGRRDWVMAGIAAVVVVGVALRFVSRGTLWLDEAQSVAIARQPLGHLQAALRHDGAPPLYYALLHGWMSLVGQSAFAVRALSGIFSVLALPVILRLGRRIGGQAVGVASLVLLAISPFAIRYAVETRMYSLLLLLALLGAHAVLSAHRSRSWWPVLGVAVVGAALLYTHYYAVFLLAVVGAAELWRGWRRHDASSWRVLAGLAVAALAYLPWVPTLLYQSRHTGAPWGNTPDANAVLGTVYSWMGGARPAAQLAGLLAIGCVVLALIGRRGRRGEVLLQTRLATSPSLLLGALLAALVIALLVDYASGQAYAPRYMSTGAGIFLVVVACGIAVLPSRRARRTMLAVLVVADLSVCAQNAWQPRTQADQVARVIDAQARPGDVVVYCPDELGPQTSRLLHTSARQVVFPYPGNPAIVNWIDYRQRVANADPASFAAMVDRMAGPHRVWLVWTLTIKPLAQDCAAIIDHFVATRGIPRQPVTRHPEFSETMSLNEYGPARR